MRFSCIFLVLIAESLASNLACMKVCWYLIASSAATPIDIPNSVILASYSNAIIITFNAKAAILMLNKSPSNAFIWPPNPFPSALATRIDSPALSRLFPIPSNPSLLINPPNIFIPWTAGVYDFATAASCCVSIPRFSLLAVIPSRACITSDLCSLVKDVLDFNILSSILRVPSDIFCICAALKPPFANRPACFVWSWFPNSCDFVISLAIDSWVLAPLFTLSKFVTAVSAILDKSLNTEFQDWEEDAPSSPCFFSSLVISFTVPSLLSSEFSNSKEESFIDSYSLESSAIYKLFYSIINIKKRKVSIDTFTF